MAFVSKRNIMLLYSSINDPYSHQVRIALSEKNINVDIKNFYPEDAMPSDLIDLNPYQSLPTLVDRDLVLYPASIILEYLDERFPHPPLLSVYPVVKANSRKMLFRIERDWYSLMKLIYNSKIEEERNKNKKLLQDSILSILPIFEDKKYFLNDEFTLLDCCIAPLFWRLNEMGIEIPSHASAILQYKERIFSRDSFVASLTSEEKEIGKVAA